MSEGTESEATESASPIESPPVALGKPGELAGESADAGVELDRDTAGSLPAAAAAEIVRAAPDIEAQSAPTGDVRVQIAQPEMAEAQKAQAVDAQKADVQAENTRPAADAGVADAQEAPAVPSQRPDGVAGKAQVTHGSVPKAPANGAGQASAEQTTEQAPTRSAEQVPDGAGQETRVGDSGPVPPASPAARTSRTRPPRWGRVAYPPGVVPAALIAGAAAAILIPWDRPGLGWVVAAAISAAAVVLVDRTARRGLRARPGAASGEQFRSDWTDGQTAATTGFAGRGQQLGRLWWAVLALALLAVGTFRAAGWLFALCVVAAGLAGSLAVVGRRSANGIVYDTLAVPLAAMAAVPWVYSATARARGADVTRRWRLALSAAVTVALLAVFVPLLGSADAIFADLLQSVTPDLDDAAMVRWIVLFVLAVLGVLGALFVLAGPPPPAAAPVRRRGLRRAEWALPVGALAILFAVFVTTQFVVLFGGDGYVQRTAGLTYAEYARTGFWQLSAVTVLTLAVLMAVLRWAAQDTDADRRWLRAMLTVVSGLALIIVASALGRMWTYQRAYGFTVLRLLVEVCEVWLGLVYLLVLLAVMRLRRAWLPRAVLGTAVATLLALAVLDPERLIAEQNIVRWQQGRSLDTDYLGTLSPDILPATDRLPEPLRTELRNQLRADLGRDTWQSWNLSRARAR
ncbi:DUF4153 domain-containing protein [Nocardia sp. R6R-6]|uniref:DUF4153 domain-containing protein n=1 Tax=Nocardia sp. R6R-6 TaxID=3459303 RepID=UPI00403DA0D4